MSHRNTNTVELKKIMIDKGIEKISELASATGVSRATLSNVLSGKTQPSAEVMNKLICTLDISPTTAGNIFFSPDLPTM